MTAYCKDCKWCKYREFAAMGVNWGWFCRLKDRITIDSIGHKTVDFSNSDCANLNQDGECPDYKRKWWKIWMTED